MLSQRIRKRLAYIQPMALSTASPLYKKSIISPPQCQSESDSHCQSESDCQSQRAFEFDEDEFGYQNCAFCNGRCRCPTSSPTELNRWMSRDMDDCITQYDLDRYEDYFYDSDEISSWDRDWHHERPEQRNDEWKAHFDECLFYRQELWCKAMHDEISVPDFEKEMKECINETKYHLKLRDVLYQENIGYWTQEQLKRNT